MGLEEDYPKAHSNQVAALRTLLANDPGLSPDEREEIALSLNEMLDKAQDLEDIRRRLLAEPHTPAEIGDLLIAFGLTTEQICGNAEGIDGKLYEIGARLRAPAAPAPLEGR